MSLCLALFAPAAQAQGVSRPLRKGEIPVLLWSKNAAAMSANAWLGGANALAPLRIVGASGQVNAGASGAGNTVITITDGTNTCIVTYSCANTAIGTGASVAGVVSDGNGTGCNYAAGASIRASVTTAGCATTQPQLWVNFFAVYR